MVSLVSLWMPIVLSAVIVFVLSSIIHMVLPYHRSDFRQLPNQDQVMDALHPFDIPPGEYMVPRPRDMKDLKSAEFAEKCKRGPVFTAIFWKYSGGIGSSLIQWFGFLLLVSLFAGYVTSRALGPGADYLQVFRFVGATSFLAYGLGSWPASIWYRRAWSTTLKQTFDGLLYALMTGGTFGWLWPK
jgi:hypothetical protein